MSAASDWALLPLAAAAVVLYLRALCRDRAPLRELLRGALCWTAPVGLALAAGRVSASPAPGPALPAAAVAGLALALVVLRRRVWSAELRAPARPSLEALLAGTLVALAAFVVLSTPDEPQAVTPPEPGSSAELAARAFPTAPPALPLRLDAANSLLVDGRSRDLDLVLQATLEPDSVLELRLRADAPPITRGMALWLSSDARLPTGFVRETAEECTPVGTSGGTVAAGRPVDVRIQARGARLQAEVDGRRVEASDGWTAATGVVVLAARGAATVSALEITPAPAAPAPAAVPVAPAPERAALAALPLALGLVFGLGLWWLAALTLSRALTLAAFAALPLALVARPEGEGTRLVEAARIAYAVAGLLVLPALVHARSARPARLLVYLLAACLAAPVSVAALVTHGRGAAGLLPPGFDHLAWAGERLDGDLVHLRHPLVRLLDEYLADHRFRHRQVALEKPAGVVRVLALGGSTTWGFGLHVPDEPDFTLALEQRLARDVAGGEPAVEVLNAAWRGATGARLFHLLRGGLLDFRPDVVVLCLTYNDVFALTRFDEWTYLEAIGAPGSSRSLVADLATAWRIQRGQEEMNRLIVEFAEWPGTTAELWARLGHEGEDTPPRRFETVLTAFAELARQEGFALVLVKEPMAGDKRFIWKDEFYAVIDRVGAAHGLPVVDPTPALQAAGGAALFQDQIHPTVAGHAVIAEVLEPVIRELVRRR